MALLEIITKRSLPLIRRSRFYCTQQKHYDIIVAGGGMVGIVLACTLGKNKILNGKRILMLEGDKPKELNLNNKEDKYSNRVVALNPSTYKLFNQIETWKHIELFRYGTVKRMQVWDAISDAMIEFQNDDFDNSIAYIVENNLILEAAMREVKNCDNVEIVYNAAIAEYELETAKSKMSTIRMENGDRYTCNLLLGCDGANSKVRKAMDVRYLSWNYHQMAVVATLHLKDAEMNVVAWQRFLPDGPIALLPLKENISSLVWSTSTEHAKKLMTLNDETFVDAVNEALWKEYKKNSIIGDATRGINNLLKAFDFPSNAVRQLPPSVANIDEGSRASFPLGFGHATNYVAPGVALVGDAAHRIHPMAGQGVNLGFGDVYALNAAISDGLYKGDKLGNLNDLKVYESERQRRNVPTMLAIDGLHRLYNTELLPVVLVRSLGLQLTNAFSPIKKTIMNEASS